MTARCLRLLRGWTAASVATGAAVLGHTVAGGPWPPVLLVALCIALSAPVCMLLAGLRLPAIGLMLSVAVSQLLFHGLFSVSGTMSAVVDHTSHAGHAVASAGPELVLQSTGAHVHSHSALEVLLPASLGPWLMPSLHVAAGILTVLVLRHGESLALRIAASLLIRARGLICAATDVIAVPPRWRCCPTGQLVLPRARAVLSWLRYRGPPGFAVAV